MEASCVMPTGRGRAGWAVPGAVAAIGGAVVSVAAGVGFGNRTNTQTATQLLTYLAARPSWYWPMVNLGFAVGAVLWVVALTAWTRVTDAPCARVLARIGLAAMLLGAAVHIVDALVSGYALPHLARAAAEGSGAGRAMLLAQGRSLLWLLGGTWSGVLMLFHGLPFVLFGFSVLADRRGPVSFALVGVLAGAGSLLAGVSQFLGLGLFPSWLFIVFAVLVSLWMVGVGILLWRRR